MGYKVDIFDEQVDDELKCPLCENILEQPMQGFNCEHLFCNDCILQWLKNNLVCPLDRRILLPNQLQQPPNIILKLLNNLKVKCNYYEYGCSVKLKLSDLNQHIKICAYKTSFNNLDKKTATIKLDESDNLNQIKQFRIAGDLSNEISEINKIVKDLNQDLELENRKSIEYARNLEVANRKYESLHQKFKKIINPFLSLIEDHKSINDNCQELNNKKLINEEFNNNLNEDNSRTCTAIIRNLNEFLNEQILEEYLRQNDISIIDCKLELSAYKRSKDFKVTIFKNEFHKLFSENLWPTGVTCQSELSNLIIFGNRQINPPSLIIKSGLALASY